MNKVISFTLYGDNPKYVQGAYKNVELAKIHYPGWTCRFYVDHKTVPTPHVRKLASMSEVLCLPNIPLEGKMRAWRFLAAGDPDVDVAIFRDTDSRLNPRGAAAVNEWLASGRRLHIMRDHEHHCCHKIYGGMWGVLKGATPHIAKEMDDFPHWGGLSQWGNVITDMAFTELIIWPKFKTEDIMHHANKKTAIFAYSRYEGCQPFPPHEPYDGFVGEVIM